MSPSPTRVFEAWLSAAQERYLADLTRPELTRALRALSSVYVERRGKLSSGAPLSSAGKRAAFALFYGPLHFLTVTEVAQAVLGASGTHPRHVVDLGCGTGAAGAAWALSTGASVEGYDVNGWAVAEAQWTYRTMKVPGSARRVPIERVRLPTTPADLVMAFVANELPVDVREAMLPRLLAGVKHGHRLLIVEPLARGVTPWWPEWERAMVAAGGRADEWRFRVRLPEFLRTLDKGAGLDHQELTARTLLIGAGLAGS
jgi:SAM-dependent methyltransferase